MNARTLLIVICCIAAFATVRARDATVGWRTDGTGRYSDAEPATEWSQRKNIIWKTEMPAPSNATPVIVGRRLFVHSEPSTLHCVNVVDGHILWERSNAYTDVLSTADLEAAGSDGLELPITHESNGYTSPVPVSDGSYVYALYGTGTVVCYDMDGVKQWARLIEKSSHRWGHSASPALHGKILIVHVQTLFALDAATGKTLWQADAEVGWGAPQIIRVGETWAVMTSKRGDIFRLSDGQRLGENVTSLDYATPVVRDNIVYSIEGQSFARSVTLKPEATAVNVDTLWQARIKGSRHYASPLLHDGLVYTISREARLSVLEQSTGTLVYEKKLTINHGNTNSVYSSVTLGGDHIFIGCEEGTTLVLKPGRTYSEVARNNLEPFRSTPVFSGDRMYLRGLRHLYCIGRLY